MECLQQLTTYLKANGIKNLESWAEDGEFFASYSTTSQGYEMRYTANFEASDTETDAPQMMMLIVSWLSRFNPERESQGLPSPRFFCEPLQDKKYDVGIKVEFIEGYVLQQDPNGDWKVNQERYTLQSQFSESLNLDDLGTLIIVDSHTQDNGLKK